MNESTDYQSKHNTIEEAIDVGKKESLKGLFLFLVEDHKEGCFYVDESAYIRGFETLHGHFDKGKYIKD